MTAANWALATVMLDGPTACLEVDGNLYRLRPSLARAGWSGATDVASLFVGLGPFARSARQSCRGRER